MVFFPVSVVFSSPNFRAFCSSASRLVKNILRSPGVVMSGNSRVDDLAVVNPITRFPELMPNVRHTRRYFEYRAKTAHFPQAFFYTSFLTSPFARVRKNNIFYDRVISRNNTAIINDLLGAKEPQIRRGYSSFYTLYLYAWKCTIYYNDVLY